MKTTILNDKDVTRQWFVVDAAGRPAGRLAAKIAHVLRGKTKPTYTPHVDSGDFVIVINADQVKLTGRKEEQKKYKHYTGFPSGLREFPASQVRAQKPGRIISSAVRGMLPGNKLADQMYKRLKVYAGAAHPHAAQQPQPLSL